MKLLAFSVRDVKAEHFNRPMFVNAVGEAMRGFQMECQDPESMLHRFPDDFTLFKVGEFDQVTGYLEACDPVALCSAREYVKVAVAQQLEMISNEEAVG